MDLISHGLMGTMMAGLGLKKKFGFPGMVTMIIANIAPDLDVLAFLKGPKTFYKYHREVTHSLMGVCILWFLISLGICLVIPVHNLFAVVGMVGVGLASHLLIDSLTPWGLPLFYPFTKKKYGFDLIWFFDPVMISSLVGGVYLAHHFPEMATVFYTGFFTLISAYLLLRVTQKRKACKIAGTEQNPRFKNAEVYILPSAISPFLWDVIYKTRNQYLYVSVDTRKENILTVHEFTSSTYHKCVKSSCESDLVDVFLKRARFPFYQVTRENGCYTVEWYDVQLLNLGGVHGVMVNLDDTGQITGEKLQIKRPVRRRKRKIEDYLREEVS